MIWSLPAPPALTLTITGRFWSCRTRPPDLPDQHDMESIFPFEADAYKCHKTAILFTYHGNIKESQY